MCHLTQVNGKTLKGPSKQAVYNYVNGVTHRRGVEETRGRNKLLTKADVRKLIHARRRLIKKAKGEARVRYGDVIEAARLGKDVSKRTVEDAMRAENIRYRPARKKIFLTEKDAVARVNILSKWIKKPARFWSEEVHAFMDNKAWPIPLTVKQRAKYNATKVTGHLRLPSEGVEHGFTRPRTEHSFLGIPSIQICAAVAKDRVILWHDCGKKWNGAVAAEIYRGVLLKALRRTWGARESFVIVEDGDRKGYQTHKAIQAKKDVSIKSMVLPPRSPSLMPLDASIWTRIDAQMTETAPAGRENKEDFIRRLQECAKSLPRGFVRHSIGKTKENIQAILDAKGFHPKND